MINGKSYTGVPPQGHGVHLVHARRSHLPSALTAFIELVASQLGELDEQAMAALCETDERQHHRKTTSTTARSSGGLHVPALDAGASGPWLMPGLLASMTWIQSLAPRGW